MIELSNYIFYSEIKLEPLIYIHKIIKMESTDEKVSKIQIFFLNCKSEMFKNYLSLFLAAFLEQLFSYHFLCTIERTLKIFLSKVPNQHQDFSL